MTIAAALTDFIEASTWRVGLDDEQIQRVHREAYARSYNAGATIRARGAPSVHWLGVVDGILKVDTISPDGRPTSFAGIPSGAWFGEGAVLKGEPSPYAVVAIRESTVAFVPRATFQWLIDESRPFSRWVIDQLNARLAHYVALIETFRFQEASGRVAYCVAELFNPQLFPGSHSRLAISQEEIARLSGLSRQNASRALHELEQLGLISMHYGVIEVLNLARLKAFSQTR